MTTGTRMGRSGAKGTGAERGWGEAVSDAHGDYVIHQLSAGAYNVALALRGDLARSWTARAHEAVYVRAGERRDDHRHRRHRRVFERSGTNGSAYCSACNGYFHA